MKTLTALFLGLLLISCGNSRRAEVSTDGTTVVAAHPDAPKITAQSILTGAEGKHYREGEIIVRYRRGRRTVSSLRMREELRTVKTRDLRFLNAERVSLPGGLSVKEAIERYMDDPDVEYAEPNYVRSACAVVPNDSFFGLQWALRNSMVPGADLHMPQAWDIITGSPGLVIAVIDTGIDYTHPDLAGNIWSNPGDPDCASVNDNDRNGYTADCRGWNFVSNNNDPMDDDGHGSHVSGIIGAAGNNRTGISGVIWDVKLMPLKALDEEGEGTVADEAEAIEYAIANGAKLINASFAGEGFSNIERSAIADADAAGILFVTAAGNGDGNSVGRDNDVRPLYPANYGLPNIISVAATDEQDRLASFSNYGRNTVDVAAPGVDIISTVPPGLSSPFCGGSPVSGYEFCAGTSMSAPHVAGLAALIGSYYPNFTYLQVRGTIIRYVDMLPSLQGRMKSGGRINAYNAVSSLLAPDGLAAASDSSASVALAWRDNATGEDGYVIERKALGGDFEELGRTAAGATSYLDSNGLRPSTTYTYRVSAFNTLPAASSFSNEASVITAAEKVPQAQSAGGGGGGCSVAATGRSAAGDVFIFALPLLACAIMRKIHRGEK